MKPDWNDAPEWANYAAMDKEGDWYWYEILPRKLCTRWLSEDGKCEMVNFSRMVWESSLKKRPGK
jgi:hypothetical protein